MANSYGISSTAHLRRALGQLADGSQASLFYAAFELRCGIEARLQDYLDAQRQTSKWKKQGWKIVAAAKELERTFRVGVKIVEAGVLDESGQMRFALYYTPVGRQLRDSGAKLGNVLHALRKPHDDEDEWWTDTRRWLQQIAGDLAVANQGTLLGPVVRSPNGDYHMELHFSHDSPVRGEIERFSRIGNSFKLQVRYFDSMPIHANAFLNPLITKP
jgi:hypothetical protein